MFTYHGGLIKQGNDEMLFRSSIDRGATLGDEINLRNSTDLEPIDAMIGADNDTVVIT